MHEKGMLDQAGYTSTGVENADLPVLNQAQVMPQYMCTNETKTALRFVKMKQTDGTTTASSRLTKAGSHAVNRRNNTHAATPVGCWRNAGHDKKCVSHVTWG